MKRLLTIALAAAFTLAIASSAFAQLSGTYTFGGSTTVAPIAYAAIEQFQKDNPDVKISYEATGSGAGLTSLLKGQYTLSGSSAIVSDDQKNQGANPIAIAYDGITIVVNKNVKVSNISKENLAKVYAGVITNWKDLGGQDMQIIVVNRDEASGTYGSFNDLVLKPVKLSYTKNVIVTKENGEVAAKVSTTPGSIGYVGLAFADQVTKAGGHRLMVGGIKDTVANVLSFKYPLSRQLFLVTMGQPKEGSVEKAFIDFILSDKGQAIVKSTDYIPLPKN
ncbi:MAG: phosphate ABC transporter substrate-binding protein [Rectinemataceae bacterium]|jgi:phosphate transport system substrate-binding protein